MWPDTEDLSCASRCREMTESTMLLRVDFEAPMAVKSHNMACRTSGCIGSILSVACRPMARAQVRHVHQLRHALMRVPGALPSGTITAVKARLMS